MMFKLILSILVIIIGCAIGNVIKTPTISINSRLKLDERDNLMHAEPQLLKLAQIRQQNIPKEPRELLSEYWLDGGKKFVEQQTKKKPNKNRAKNVIMFMGDGMSIPTQAATRMHMGGEEKRLSFEEFPSLGMAKTYCVNYQVPDSACTATAYLSGSKGNYGTIGVNAKVKRSNCELGLDETTHTSSIAKWAIDAGKSAGVVTNTRITHASPAGVYAHTAERDWENDAEIVDMNCSPDLIDDIAEQLVRHDLGKKLKVIMGGGRRNFRGTQIRDEENKKGQRLDQVDLIEEWLAINLDDGKRSYVWNKTELMSIDPKTTDYLLGLFESGHMRFNYDIDNENIGDLEPKLSEMVDKAIDILSKDENGYFLFVEGGLIDRAHHDTMAHYALDETVEFSRAISLAMDKVNLDETLIVVTADHSHTMSYAGYNDRGGDIFGISGISNLDQLPFMALSYANGLGYNVHVNQTDGSRINPSSMNYDIVDFQFPSMIPLDSETHGADDVAVYAIGPWSHLFGGSFEQNVIPHYMAYAACIGTGQTVCDTK